VSGQADIFGPLPAIEAALGRAVARADATPRLREAIAYATLGAGKRIRPLLAWHCCEAFGGRGDDALPACIAVELVHCFSLVHDDLPALDNDALRRGKPTVHVQFGEAMAVLAGDALLTMASLALAREWEHEDDRTIQARRGMAHTLADATSAMIKGQVADTLHDFDASDATPAQRLEFIHRHKTGALLGAACALGVHAACFRHGGIGLDADPFAVARAYAEPLGLLFQAVDDLLDVTQSAEHTGKRTHKDEAAGKLTFPAVYGVERTRELIAGYEREAVEAVAVLGEKGATLRAIAHFVATRTR
jgi:geranylgeranyl pyrophosphate synthase